MKPGRSFSGCRRGLALPTGHNAVDMIWELNKFGGILPTRDEVRVIAFWWARDVSYAHGRWHTGTHPGDQCMLLGETRKLIEQCAGTQRRGMTEESLIGFVGQTMRNHGPTLGYNRFTKLAWPLAC